MNLKVYFKMNIDISRVLPQCVGKIYEQEHQEKKAEFGVFVDEQ